EGSWEFIRWGNNYWNTSAPPTGGDIHAIYTGRRLSGSIVQKRNGACQDDDDPMPVYAELILYEAYSCPDGYQVEAGGTVASVSPCFSKWKHTIRGPQMASCD